MEKIASLLPTRMRPKLFKRFLDSFMEHSICSDLKVALQEDDADLMEYQEILSKFDVPYMIMGNIGLAKKTNALCKRYPGYYAYTILNDDYVIKTPKWDRKIIDRIEHNYNESGHRLWFPMWRDGLYEFGTGFVQPFATSQLLIDVLGGTLNPGPMNHFSVDSFYTWLAKEMQLIIPCQDILIDHIHFTKDPAKLSDDNYRETRRKYRKTDYPSYLEWLKKSGDDYKKKISDIINK